MSVEDDDESGIDLAMDTSMATIEVDIDGINAGPHNRYKKPRRKLQDSDMGMLSRVLENDKSVQRLPAIHLKNIDNKDQAFFSERSQADLYGS